MKTFFLTRQNTFAECQILEVSKTRRKIKIVDKKSPLYKKVIWTHADGVKIGKMYPRIFTGDAPPKNYFEHGGRILLRRNGSDALVPVQEPYRFTKTTVYVMDAIMANDKMLLTGEAGVGKTSMVEQIAARINHPVLRVNLNGETRIGDFLGRLHVVGGNKGSVTSWIDGILPLAMKNGYWLILDEIDMAEPNILALLHPVLEPNGRLVLKENQSEEVKPHPEFRIFATANSVGSMTNRMSTYSGTNIMNEAFLDRWHIITVPQLDEKTEIRVIKEKIPQLPGGKAKRIVKFATMVRTSMRDQLLSLSTFSTRRCLQWASKLAFYRNAEISAEMVFLNKVTPEDKQVLLKQIHLLFGKVSRKNLKKESK